MSSEEKNRRAAEAVISTDFIPSTFRDIARRFEAEGYEACFVGGCVRDALLGRELHDFDLAVAASPEEMKRLFPDLHLVETGVEHGTLTFVTEDGALEVTSFRKDVILEGGGDHRHPAGVLFGRSLEEDLARRDFTVNALALRADGSVIDVFGGLHDLEDRSLRAVGEAECRLEEDALRILRALRFSSLLEFEIEGELAAAMHAKRRLLPYLSVERVDKELLRFFEGKTAPSLLLQFWDLFRELFPPLEILERVPLDFFFRIFGAEASLAEALPRLQNGRFSDVLPSLFRAAKPARTLRCWLFFLCVGAAELLSKELCLASFLPREEEISISRLAKADEAELAEAVFAVSMKLHGPKKRAVQAAFFSRFLRRAFPKSLVDLKRDLLVAEKAGLDLHDLYLFKMNLRRGMALWAGARDAAASLEKTEAELRTLRKELEEEKKRGLAWRPEELALRGGDLARRGWRGREISDALAYLREFVLEDARRNKKEILWRALEERYGGEQGGVSPAEESLF